MANLYKCDSCGETEEDTSTRLVIQLTQPGKNWKDRRNFDLCPVCYRRAEVKAFMQFLKVVESPKEASSA